MKIHRDIQVRPPASENWLVWPTNKTIVSHRFGVPILGCEEEFKRCSSWSMGDPTDLENAFSLPITGGLPGRVGSDGTGVSISGGETSTPRGETYSDLAEKWRLP